MIYWIYMIFVFMFATGIFLFLNKKEMSIIERVNLCSETVKREIPKIKEVFLGRYMEKKRKERVDREIFEAISFLRNIVVLGREQDVGLDYVLQLLCEKEGVLKEGFSTMLSLIRTNQMKEAERRFNEYAGSEAAKDFCRLIMKWDSISAKDLLETLTSYEKAAKEIMITNIRRKDEITSNIIYIPVVLNVIVIFIDFLCVAFFIEQKEMLDSLF